MTMSDNTRADRIIQLRAKIRYHENEARIIESFASHKSNVDDEITSLEKRIASLTKELEAMKERRDNLSPDLLAEHQREAKKYKRELALFESSDEVKKLMEMVRKINSNLPEGVSLQEVLNAK